MRGLSPGPKRIDFDDDTFPNAMSISSFFPFFSLRGAGGGGHHIGGGGQKQWHSRVVGIFLHLACGGDFAGLLQPMKYAKSSRQRRELPLLPLILHPASRRETGQTCYFRISPSTTLHIFVSLLGFEERQTPLEEQLVSRSWHLGRGKVAILSRYLEAFPPLVPPPPLMPPSSHTFLFLHQLSHLTSRLPRGQTTAA